MWTQKLSVTYQLNVAHVARKKYKQKKPKQTNASAHLVPCRFKKGDSQSSNVQSLTGSKLSFQNDCSSDPKISADQCQYQTSGIAVQQPELDKVSHSAPSDPAGQKYHRSHSFIHSFIKSKK